MVGNSAKRVSLLDFTRRMIAEQYELGGLDCFRLCYDFIVESGVDLPKSIGETNLENYPTLFEENPDLAIEVMIEFIQKHLAEIQLHEAFAGDILFLKLKNSTTHPFLAIHGGNGNIISVTEKHGVRATPMKHYDLKKVFRCHKRSRL